MKKIDNKNKIAGRPPMTNEEFKKRKLEEFEKEFPIHDQSHCSGHLHPEFEGHPNYLWVEQFIVRTIDQALEKGREEGIEEKINKIFPKWLESHPDVWHKNEHGVSHFWWVQNAIGDIVGWDNKWYSKLLVKLEKKFMKGQKHER